jgi:biotin carboxylase
MPTDGVLVLSHCGFSFVDDLIDAIEARGLRAWILTSRPLPEHGEQRLVTLRKKAAILFSSASHHLVQGDVENAIGALIARDLNVRACISVWEGYRALMAYGNKMLGVRDLAPSKIIALRNKLHVRNALHEAGLSQVKARALTPATLEELRGSDCSCFVKPIQGVASYGAFRLTADTTWNDIERIAAQIRQDTLYSQVVSSEPTFLVEDYVPGTECSFEVLANAGRTFIVGIHEKCEVTESGRTVLEDSCTSPPISVDANAIAQGINWVRKLLQQLSLDDGCFHVEARFDRKQWELIEINLRLGGSLISQSVKTLNEEAGLLELWLDLLLTGCELEDKLRRLSYPDSGVAPGENATFFRIYFAESGRIVRTEIVPTKRSPAVTQILLKDGDDVSDVSREVFLGQMLWKLARSEQSTEVPILLQESRTSVRVHYEAGSLAILRSTDSDGAPLLLIVDYNLTRIADVATIARHARTQHGMAILLIRASPGDHDEKLCDHVIDLDPMKIDFVPRALSALTPFRSRLKAGLVFSDNAVHSGALLLEKLGLPVDSATLALGAFSKLSYRAIEARVRDLLEAQGVMVPRFSEVTSIEDLYRFAETHPEGFVLKPSCEGNNRGVVVVQRGDDLDAAFSTVRPYLHGGALCESFIPHTREFSFDGVGAHHFITEKVSATGAYPVEIAQILPARLFEHERLTLTRTGRLVNLLVGQVRGPFHNEIKLSDDGLQSAVVEPNRRPAGMKIWTLAEAVFGTNLYALWVDTALGLPGSEPLRPASGQAATVMLGVADDGVFAPLSQEEGVALFDRVVAQVAGEYGIKAGACRQIEFGWLHTKPRFIPALPRDNADFAAQACIRLDVEDLDIRPFITSIRTRWREALVAELSFYSARHSDKSPAA